MTRPACWSTCEPSTGLMTSKPLQVLSHLPLSQLIQWHSKWQPGTECTRGKPLLDWATGVSNWSRDSQGCVWEFTLYTGTGQRIQFRRLQVMYSFIWKLGCWGYISSKMPYSCYLSHFVVHECLKQSIDTLSRAQSNTLQLPLPFVLSMACWVTAHRPPIEKLFPKSSFWLRAQEELQVWPYTISPPPPSPPPSSSSIPLLCFKVQTYCFHTFCLAWQAFIKNLSV